ncbi:uncharacterized protein G6M90_00g013570 [Metarhizium brunneum]|uniref:Uncharacterized protein n=1 Tax=Metarhizium brunneum TaxID=500148 RepID=A0A7D5USQ7_9HYPO|nr:hypothetical protein G6M90_00g013570 [Metarhizium brunneum]
MTIIPRRELVTVDAEIHSPDKVAAVAAHEAKDRGEGNSYLESDKTK